MIYFYHDLTLVLHMYLQISPYGAIYGFRRSFSSNIKYNLHDSYMKEQKVK